MILHSKGRDSMKSLIRSWRGVLLLLFFLLLISAAIFTLCSDFVIGIYLLVFVFSGALSLFAALCSKNHPVPILWMRGTDIKKADTAAFCSALKKPTLIFLLTATIPDVLFVYLYLLAQRQFTGIIMLWFALCLMGYLFSVNRRLRVYETVR